ncbi:tricarboxylate transporter [Thraustotheca clavata]|uniref:Tricarboxylate transporter n=1 Tax=Thraustotheca clavata TaxID=74557 RepID=A0A1V9ZVE8_9STRA|nr:tricarboxylate transporter [Thraustotheca clavata]
MAPDTKHAHPMIAVLSGSIAGGIEATATWPMEMIKTNLQLGTMKSHYTGMLGGFRYHLANDGVIALYRGLMPVVIGSLPKAGIRFGVYDYLKRQFAGADGTTNAFGNLTAGIIAGSIEATLATTPIETVKTKLIDANCGMVRGVRNIVQQEGIRGLYQGLTATIMKQASNHGLRFMWFGEYKQRIPDFLESRGIVENYDDISKTQLALVSLVGGMTAGIFSTFGNNPFDVLKTKMQGLKGAQYASTWDCAKQIMKNEGFLGFYAGTIPRLGRVIPGQGVIFMSYDSITRWVATYFDDHEIHVRVLNESKA